MGEEQKKRTELRRKYLSFLDSVDGITCQPVQNGVTNSEQYFPLQIDPETFGRSRDDIYNALKGNNIFSRKYFHPICTDFAPYRSFKIHSVRDVPHVEKIKSRVLCLPFHSGVTDDDIDCIAGVFGNT